MTTNLSGNDSVDTMNLSGHESVDPEFEYETFWPIFQPLRGKTKKSWTEVKTCKKKLSSN